jgi:hypothetical protein
MAFRLVLWLSILAFSMPSWAQDSAPVPEESSTEKGEKPTAQDRADALIAEGVELRKQGREREALARFRRANELHSSPRAVAQMGLAEKSLRQYLDAERHLEAALESADDPWIVKNREALELARDIVAKQLAWVKVTTNVSPAELAINGVVVATLPLEEPHRVVAGTLAVEVRADGHVTEKRERIAPAGTVVELDIELSPVPKRPKPKRKPKRNPPAADDADGLGPYAPWIIASGAVGTVALATGIALGIRTIQLAEERDALCPEPECTSEEGIAVDEEARGMALGSTISFVLGGAAGVAALVLWLVEPDEEPPVSAVVTSEQATIHYRFAF